jgi:hypothetical protein
MTNRLNYCSQAAEMMAFIGDVDASMMGIQYVRGHGRSGMIMQDDPPENMIELEEEDEGLDRAIRIEALECMELMKKAEKFILPDWGRIFEPEELELCMDVKFPSRLPYPIVALEFPCNYKNPKCEPMMPQELPSSKRIALCVESEALEEHTGLLKHIHEKHASGEPGFYVFPIAYSDNGKVWTPPPSAMFFPRSSSSTRWEEMREGGLLVVLPLGSAAYTAYPPAERERRAVRDCADEIFAILHTMVALSIDKGRYETLPAPTKLNKKRAKKNRVPLYEYKILDIVADILHAQPSQPKPHQGGTHASPRMHKRRGHVRRLRSGKTTWVRNAIVGKPGTGAVEKDYAVHE